MVNRLISGQEHRITLFKEVYDALKNGYNKRNLQYACTVLYHLLGTFRYVPEQKSAAPDNEQSRSFINLAIHYMNEHLNGKVTLEELAKHTHYSPPHLHKLFVKATGYAPINYFLNLKIDRACYYLLHTNYKINQIAKILGFKDAYYFSKLFTKIKGVAPSAFRKQCIPLMESHR